MSRGRVILIIVIAFLVGGFFLFDLSQYLTLEQIKARQAGLQGQLRENPVETVILFFLVYVAVTGLSLPGAAAMSLVIGAVFGLLWGVILVSFASTLGATLAFLASRFLLRNAVQTRFREQLGPVNEGIRRDGAFYLFGLRLVPIFPFFIINLVMGLTPMRTWTFAWVSQVGMLAGTVVYINAGTELGRLDSLAGILSPRLVLSFALLGLFPLLARRALGAIRARRALAGYTRPTTFDRNLIVIGAGSGGLVAAYIAAALKAGVTLIEKGRMGGDCLNTGCVPSKALIRSARFLDQLRRAERFGFTDARAEVDFARVMERVRSVVERVAPHDSVERYTSLGVDVIQGEARIVDPYTVEVNGQRLTSRGIIVATGARPLIPPIPGVERVDCLTSDTLWRLRTLPRRLLVLGGGPIGCELAQCFARFGSAVTIVEMAPRLLIREDDDVSALVAERFREEGIDIRTGHRALAFHQEQGSKRLIAEYQGGEVEFGFDQVLIAVGRVASSRGFGLEELGVRLSDRGTIEVNGFLQTNFPNIYACGDVAGPYQFTHTAAHQAWYAAVNALFGPFKRFRADYSVIPFATFTDPEVGRVGLNEREAVEQGVPFEVSVYPLEELDRAIADGETRGFVKVLTVPGRDRILGATIVGEHAAELVNEFVAAMRQGFGLNKILGTIHIYPTWSEAGKFVAGKWRRDHQPRRLLAWAARFHAWRRGRAAG
ncbi:MAG: pyridine nucleotide-disulfide oxidoreductase [Candidatus Sedimenticola endophacoides]|uniref:Pyridine nucleotide-disulfide oxidoreductase n=2 Tax=Candidatus Sedimenticola endophacoides TaxID=2548426 RepID=A0A6N4DX47_9GAMM|nr:MAG: pyridine nucleotide-disulfide oxidoreductase [Candidatus Sedimenticola endophacoides]OQX36078.1 MAG: pyridine nucleotide-disulfide oxidoreductase [Candidatus Sedimenticola endophacoides]OQX40799.1 MAG: pyridine nucleotide-disulfide oxidoreductase [Candidatus Sedimenticola endophacoides]PUE00656.1 MAG: pyridine nucleotide-disulfide oxidoreductase [Candidatus Sedimenticola endophacoides]PUE01907.1 MAG: pyridine nucleotide-disulfide oxidoreductase [Candidatus Sedimenticola endophacoides]